MKKLSYLIAFVLITSTLYSQSYDFKQIKVDSVYEHINDLTKARGKAIPTTVFQIESSKSMVVWSSFSSIFIIYKGRLHQINDSLFLESLLYHSVPKQIRFINDTTFMCLYVGEQLSLIKFEGLKFNIVYKGKPPTEEYYILGFDFDSKGKVWITTPLWYNIMIDGDKQDLVFGKDTLHNKDTLIDKYWAHRDIIPSGRVNNIKIIDDEIYYCTDVGIAKYNIANGMRSIVVDESKNSSYSVKYYRECPIKIKNYNGRTWFLTKEPALFGLDKDGYQKINLREYSIMNCIDSIKSIYDYAFDADGSLWLTIEKWGKIDTTTLSGIKLFHIIDKDNYTNVTQYLDKFDYTSYFDSTKNKYITRSNPRILTLGNNNTLFIGTLSAGLVYFGENPLTTVEDNDNVFALWKVYPNPAKSIVKAELHCNATFNPAETEISLYNYQGCLIKKIERFTITHDKTIGKAFIEFYTSVIPKGLYFLCIKVGEEKNMEGLIIE
jgi:hypothetical protein